MRGQSPYRLNGPALGPVLALGLIFVFGAALSQTTGPIQVVPRLTGNQPEPMVAHPIPPLGRPVVDDVRRMRNYPEQPPIIPHAIEGYQLTLNTNRCMDCHTPEFTEGSGAPMISVTHFMDREGQVLTGVTPRRYFCTACHVPQTDMKPLVQNTFRGSYQRLGNP